MWFKATKWSKFSQPKEENVLIGCGLEVNCLKAKNAQKLRIVHNFTISTETLDQDF